jgi:homoserine dehydrogenase
MLTGRGAPPGLALRTICTRHAEGRRVAWTDGDVAWTDDVDTVLDSDADIVVELIGGIEPATGLIEQALRRGKSVVTANKQVVARSGPRLERVAAGAGGELRFEAAVAGVIPVVRGLEGLAADRLLCIAGVLNGTCNYILTRLDGGGTSFAEALAEAQANGFAEADPSSDLDGLDASAKLAILTALGFRLHVAPEAIPTRSIRGIETSDVARARELGCAIRQIAWAVRDDEALAAGVQPALVPATSPWARTVNSENVVLVAGERSGELVFAGRGAGPEPTAVAVVSDLLSIARGRRSACRASQPPLAAARLVRGHVAPHYLRVGLSGGLTAARAFAALQPALDRHAVRWHRVFQPLESTDALAVATGPASATHLDAAVRDVVAADARVSPGVCLPVLSADWFSTLEQGVSRHDCTD